MKTKKKDGSISEKISNSIVRIALISCLIIGAVGLISIAVINMLSQQVYKQNLQPMPYLYQVTADFSDVRVNLRNLIMKNGDEETVKNKIETSFDDMNKQLNEYQKTISNAEERKIFSQIRDDVYAYIDVKENVIADVESGDYKSATALLSGTTAADLTSKTQQAFTENIKQAQQRNQIANIIFFSIIGVFAAVIFLIVLIARKRGARVAEGISDPINKMVEAAESISKGNLDVDIDIDTTDETGILAQSFRKIIDSLQLMKTDVNMLISEALEGRLDTRADVERHEGDYRDIIEGVNKMLDTVKAPLDVASEFITRLADGEQQENIENNYLGYYAKLIDNLNNVKSSINILEEEAAKLAEAGQNGELDVRGDETRLKGSYAKIITGVNATFDAIKEPLDVASVYIQKLANGDNMEDIDNHYKGYYANLIENLLSVKDSLRILLKESLRLAEAGQNGELNVRGDLSQIQGNFARIIDGINKTLEAFAAPLEESNVVLGKMAVNDYSAQMSGGYKGMLKDFAESINSVRERLLSVEAILMATGEGSTDSLDELQEIGKRSENDNLMPSMISMMTSIKNLIEETDILASAAVEGNLGVRGDESKFEGGYRQIIEGMNRTLEAIAAPIEESSHVLEELSHGDLSTGVKGEYKGEYNKIKLSLNQAIQAFNELLSEINISSSQVAVGAKQVSDASQSLSQGATEQASSVEELTSSITQVASQTRQNAADASKASALAQTAQTEAEQGNEKMGRMLESMHDINDSSANISKIIKVIDDIAFQTNILALNAAVEAARAGQYGKGFAVVAEEVRNLAAKSAEAAKETTALIEGSINKVEIGTKIANETADMLKKISESIQTSTALVSNIATASNEQATAIAQIDKGVTQVSDVVQTNSATSEESAASSEELSGQAETLRDMVGKFKLKNETDYDKQASVTAKKAEAAAQSVRRADQPSQPSADHHKIKLEDDFGKY